MSKSKINEEIDEKEITVEELLRNIDEFYKSVEENQKNWDTQHVHPEVKS